MTARPLLFSGPMIRALLEGRKTQTRRVVKAFQVPKLGADGTWFAVAQKHSRWGFGVSGQSEQECARELAAWGCPYGKPGDLLWVRETWAHYHTVNHICRTDGRAFSEVSDGLAADRADGHDSIDDLKTHIRLMSGCDLEEIEVNGDRWRPSIHMPRWASRLTLEITGVRVERLNDISADDCRAEGALLAEAIYWPTAAVSTYRELWESINGPGSWDANEWVWVIEFRVHKQNVDALLKARAA